MTNKEYSVFDVCIILTAIGVIAKIITRKNSN